MTSSNASGAGAPNTDPAETIRQPHTPQDRPERNAPEQLPWTTGEYHPPGGRRHLGVVIVRACPACRHLHLHRTPSAAAADGAIRTGSCGSTYKIRVQQPAPRLGEAA